MNSEKMAHSPMPFSPQEPLKCGMCGSIQEVVWYCKNCGGDLCSVCKGKHPNERPMFRKHEIIPKANVPQLKKQEMCANHPTNPVIMYCNCCLKLVCSSCITHEHRGHDLDEIDYAMKKIHSDLDKFREQLEQKVLGSCSKEENQLSDNRIENERWFTSVQDKIDARRQDMRKAVDITCEKLKAKAVTDKKDNEREMDQTRELLDRKVKEVKQIVDSIKAAPVLKYSEKIALRNKVLENNSFEIPKVAPLHFSTFEPGKHNNKQIEEQIGEFPDHRKSRDLLRNTSLRISISSTTSQSDTISVIDKADPCSFTVRVQRRQRQAFSVDTIVASNTNRAWVCTYKATEIIVIDMDGEILKRISTDFEVSNFDILPSNEIVAVDFGGECVKRLSHTGRVISSIATSGCRATGITICDNRQNVAVAMNKPFGGSKLVLYKLDDGQVLMSTQYTSRGSFFVSSQRVAQNKNGDFCVVHNSNCTVYGVSKKGDVMFKYKGHSDCKMKFNPWDICCDVNNFTLVSDTNNHSIHVLDHEGRFTSFLKTTQEGISQLRGLGLDTSGKLWIGDKEGNLCIVKYGKSSPDENHSNEMTSF